GLLVAVLLLAGAAEAVGADVHGRQLYRRYCASCHGLEARGDGPDAEAFAEKPRDLREGFLADYPVDDLVRRIRHPAPLELALDLSALKQRASEVNALAAHVEHLPSVNWEKVGAGWDTYADRCMACHGRYGLPTRDLPAGVRTPRDLSDPEFQSAISDKD